MPIDPDVLLAAGAQLVAGALPNWEISPEAWDTVVIGGEALPGVCEVSGEVEHKVTKTSPPGRNGGETIYLGLDESDFNIRVLMWEPQQLERLHRMIRTLFIPSLTKEGPSSLTIRHPGLALVGIYACIVVRISVPRFAEQGLCEVVLRCRQKFGNASSTTTVKKIEPSILEAGPGALDKQAQDAAKVIPPSKSGAGNP